MAHIAEGAAACAFVAHDHESGRAFAKTFADVGAAGFFAHRHQFVGAQHVFDLVKTCRGRASFDTNPIGLFQYFALLHFHGDA